MVNLYTHKESNIRKTWFLMTAFFVFIVAIGWIFGQYYGSSLILYIAISISIAMSVTSYWFSDKIVLKMSRAEPATMEKFPELYRIVENLSIAAGLPMPKLYYINERAPNAFATGRDPEHAVVAVTSGLMERLDRSELEGVLAHELSHVGNRDMLVSTVAVVLAGSIAMLSNIFIRSLWFGGGRRRSNGQGGALMLVLVIAAAILAPIAALLIQLAISRKREYLADASGALLTRYPEGLASALEKISQDPTEMRAANNATAHLWLDDPFKGKHKKSWFHKLFMTHPPIHERVATLRGMAK